MHELSLVSDLLALLERQAKEQAFARVSAIWLEVGHLSCVAPEALRFCFDAVKRGTLAEAATLHIAQQAGEATCRRCGRVFAITDHLQPCPDCGAVGHALSGGQALSVRELEVE